MIWWVKIKPAQFLKNVLTLHLPRFKCLSILSAASPSLPWWVLTLVEATASCTLSIMNSLVILREGSSLKRELIRATLAASRLASALLKQYLRKEGEESIKDLPSHYFVPASMGLQAFLFIHLLSVSILLCLLLILWRSHRFSFSSRSRVNVLVVLQMLFVLFHSHWMSTMHQRFFILC